MQSIKEVRVFWTGGWDSTFRIVQLSRMDKVIQPVYIKGDGRPSEQKEIETMCTIIEEIGKKEETIATFLPIEIVDKNDIPENQQITNAFETMRKKIRIGTQYEWLARYAVLHPYVEIGPECPDGEYSGIVEAINTYGKLIPYEDSWILDKKNSTEECNLLFGNYSYPIIKTTERKMLDLIREWGYEEVMSHIWFCHNPIGGKPCGLCRPCEQKMDEHMEFLLDANGQKRYHKAKKVRKIFGLYGMKIYCKLYRLYAR